MIVHPLQAASRFQTRPELEEVMAWWRAGGRGVSALVGLGGAGKTALAAEFLDRLRSEGFDRLFVYSFYDQPSTESFFSSLHEFANPKATSSSSHFACLEALRQREEHTLLILDGLERAQSDGTKGAPFGEIEDVFLRDLILAAATGLLGKVGILTTTRFALTPLENEPMARHHRIDVGPLSDKAALALVRSRGITGTDSELMEMIEASGRHALLLELNTSLLVFSGAQFSIPLSAESSPSDDVVPRNPAFKLERRLFLIARRYRAELEKRSPETWALLRLACLFQNGISETTLLSIRAQETASVALRFEADADVENALPVDDLIARVVLEATRYRPAHTERAFLFCSADRLLTSQEDGVREPWRKISTRLSMPLVEGDRREVFLRAQILAGISEARRVLEKLIASGSPRNSLETLEVLGLIELRDGFVRVHPAIRDAFAPDDPAEIQGGHQRAMAAHRKISLSKNPGSELEPIADAWELLYHMIGSGDVAGAWRFYRHRLGGFSQVGAKRAAYSEGERYCRLFAGVELPEGQAAAFFNDWGLFLERLGKLDDASRCFEVAADKSVRTDRFLEASMALQNLADAQALRGQLLEAKRTVIRAATLSTKAPPTARNDPLERFSHERRAEVFEQLIQSGWNLQPADSTESPPPERTIESAIRGEEWVLAERLCRDAMSGVGVLRVETSYREHLCLYFSEIARELDEADRAAAHLKIAHDFALHQGDRELLAKALAQRARLELLAVSRAESPVDRCSIAIRHAMRIAQDSGYELLVIDLHLVRAELALLCDDRDSAHRDAQIAIERATVCGYARAIKRGEGLRAFGLRRSSPRKPKIRVMFHPEAIFLVEEMIRAIHPDQVAERCFAYDDVSLPRVGGARGAIVLLVSSGFLRSRRGAAALAAPTDQTICVPVDEEYSSAQRRLEGPRFAVRTPSHRRKGWRQIGEFLRETTSKT
ncbi:MAG: NACHT domain-containing protein [Deltaproteobacteria bacterium]|nr:NACHT domain-containing protein [Deltaproteobacteria bacterium]